MAWVCLLMLAITGSAGSGGTVLGSDVAERSAAHRHPPLRRGQASLGSFNVYSPFGIDQVYYQFSDSIVESARAALGIRSVQLRFPVDVVRANLGPRDVVLILADLYSPSTRVRQNLLNTSIQLINRGVMTVVYETEPQHDPQPYRYLQFRPIAVWSYK